LLYGHNLIFCNWVVEKIPHQSWQLYSHYSISLSSFVEIDCTRGFMVRQYNCTLHLRCLIFI